MAETDFNVNLLGGAGGHDTNTSDSLPLPPHLAGGGCPSDPAPPWLPPDPLGLDPAEILRAVRILTGRYSSEHCFELRVLHGRRPGYDRSGQYSGYFRDPAAIPDAMRLAGLVDYQGVYVTLNPLDPIKLQQYCEGVIRYAGDNDCAHNADVVARHWLPIDIDPVRPRGVTATDEEHATAWHKAETMRAALQPVFGDPCIVDSGSGYWLWYPVDLSADDGGLVPRVLASLAAEYSDTEVHIDTGVANAARIGRLPGSENRKGAGVGDRPHRPARIVDVPERLEPLSAEQLEAWLAANQHQQQGSEEPASHTTSQESSTGRQARIDIPAWAEMHGLELVQRADSTGPRDGRPARRWNFVRCPLNDPQDPHEENQAAYIIQYESGAIAAGCHHDRCSWGWRDLRARYPLGAIAGDETKAEVKIYTTDRRRTVDPAIEALTALEGEQAVYQRAGRLCDVVQPDPRGSGPARHGGWIIRQLPPAAIAERLTDCCYFEKWDASNNEWVPSNLPKWLVSTIEARGQWPHIPYLARIAPAPPIRPDGSVYASAGYDPETYSISPGPPQDWQDPPQEISQEQAAEAWQWLYEEVFRDFPFAGEHDAAAALAMLLSMIGRPALGPDWAAMPAFICDATTAGTGKGYLIDACHLIASGYRAPCWGYTAHTEEMDKRIATVLAAGDAVCHLDNVDEPVGGGLSYSPKSGRVVKVDSAS